MSDALKDRDLNTKVKLLCLKMTKDSGKKNYIDNVCLDIVVFDV